MKTTPIGRIDHGIDGHDSYNRIELEDSDIEELGARDATDWVHKRVLQQFSFDGRGPGTLFLTSFTVIPFPHDENAFIVIAHVRRDC